ncbi:MAG: S41 family peptidase [Gemmatimonadetes bacterium]|nr:S41 family peptidase [Gemmatimonadota bacterium]
MKTNRTLLAPLFIALVALATGGWFLQRSTDQQRSVYSNAQLFEQVLQYVSEAFVDEKEPSDLYRMAIDGMLESLGDPHTGFMPASEYENLRIQTQGEYGGLGISISRRGGWVTVITPLPGTPGERAGLRAGDQIIEVEGESTKGWTDDQAVAKLRGPKGTTVSIRVARLGVPDPIPLRITRDEIRIKSVPAAYMIDKDIGYVELVVFSETSTDEVRNAIRQLKADGAKSILLDLRGNSGGLLEQGLSVSDLFLGQGQTVVETRGRLPEQSQRLIATHDDEFPDLPIAVLVGPYSASAAEIVAGALQDHDRALVVGRPTFGKGSVQTVYRLASNNWLKLTTARWYTPSGRSIQKPYGIDHPVEGDNGAVEDLQEKPVYKTDAGRTVYGGGGIHPDVFVTSDTTTLTERSLIEALNVNAGKFWEALFTYGVRYNKENPGLAPGFAVTDAMLNRFHTDLETAGIPVERNVFEGGKRYIARHLAREITQSRWGVAEARRRTNADDEVVREALALLNKADTQAALFQLASQLSGTSRSELR